MLSKRWMSCLPRGLLDKDYKFIDLKLRDFFDQELSVACWRA